MHRTRRFTLDRTDRIDRAERPALALHRLERRRTELRIRKYVLLAGLLPAGLLVSWVSVGLAFPWTGFDRRVGTALALVGGLALTFVQVWRHVTSELAELGWEATALREEMEAGSGGSSDLPHPPHSPHDGGRHGDRPSTSTR